MAGDLDDTLHVDDNTYKSLRSDKLSVLLSWKGVQQIFCAFSVLTILTNVSHTLSSFINLHLMF